MSSDTDPDGGFTSSDDSEGGAAEGGVNATSSGRDSKGRFLPGNPDAVAGGKARAASRRKPERGSGQPDSNGSVVPSAPREADHETARQSLLNVLSDLKAPAAAKVSAARSLAELLDRGQTRPLPTSVAQIRAMTDDELHELALSRGLQLPWPVPDPELEAV